MLCIRTGSDETRVVVWHMGEPWPLVPGRAKDVQEVQADSDELGWILANVEGIPTARRKVLHWFGDDAKFITEVLRSAFDRTL